MTDDSTGSSEPSATSRPMEAGQTPVRELLSERELAAFQAVVEAFGEAAHVEVDTVLARRSVERAHSEREDLGEWTQQVRLIGKYLGLRLTVMPWSIREAAQHASPDHPVALRASGDSAPEPWILIRRSGLFYAQVSFPGTKHIRRISYRKLAKALGYQSARETAFAVTSQPLAPWEGSHYAHDSNTHAHGGHGHAHENLSPTARLFRLARPERPDLLKILIFSAATGLLALGIPLAVNAVVTVVQFGNVQQPLIVLVAALLGTLTLSSVMRALQFYIAELIQRRLFVRLASDLSYRLPRVRVEAFSHEHAPEIVNRFFAISTLQKTASTILLDGINLALSGLIGLIILGFYHPLLLAFDVVILISVGLIFFVLGRGAVRTSIEDSEAMYRQVGWMEELGRFPFIFKSPLAAQLARDRVDRATHVYVSARARHFRILFRQKIGALALQVIGSTALLGIGGQLVMVGTLTLGQLVAAEIIVTVVLGSLAKFGKQLEAWYDILAAVDKLGHLIDLPLERESGENRLIKNAGASVDLNSVTFGFHDGHELLNGVQRSFGPGRRIGFDERHGRGYSTLFELILGLRDPASGSILVDGMDVRHWRLDSLRDQVALVHHDEIVKGTVYENLCMGRNTIRHSEIKSALEGVLLWEDVLQLPEGVHTPLLSGGAPLSTTQRLRLVIARAMLAKPRILLLDGVIDRLGETERTAVLKMLFQEARGATILIVSQLPKVLEQCDEVYELDHGQLVPVGSMHETQSTRGWQPVE